MSQLPFEYPVEPSYNPEDFVVTESNQKAHGLLLSGLSAGIGAILSGPPASGKSHLLHIWADLNHADILPVQSDFRSLKSTDTSAVAVDDIDALIGGGEGETWLFDLYNHQKEMGAKLLLTASRPAAAMPCVLPDWYSRAQAMDQISLLEPNDTILEIILTKMAADKQIVLEPGLVAYLVPRMERTYDAARGLLNALDAASLREKREITKPLARKVMIELGY